jgi:hypothetical protein
MASQAKVTLLIETKFEKFQELKKAGNELQEALGVGKIAKEYEKLDKSLGSILSKIKQINQASGKSGLLGGGGGPITGAHGARGVGSAATAMPSNVLYGPKGEVISTLGGDSGGRTEGQGRRATGGLGAAELSSAIRFQAKEQVRQEKRERLSQFSQLTGAVAGQARANVRMDAREAAWSEARAIDIAFPSRPSFGRGFGAVDIPVGAEGLRTLRPQTRPDPFAGKLNNLGVGIRDAALAAQAQRVQIRSRNIRRAGMIGGGAAIFGAAAGAAGSLATGTLGGMGGAGATMGAFGTLGGGALGAALGSFGGYPGAFAGALGGSMAGRALGSTFGTIGGQVAQYGEKGLALQELASGLAAMGAGAMGGQVGLERVSGTPRLKAPLSQENIRSTPNAGGGLLPTDMQRRGGPGGIVTTALGAKTKVRVIPGQPEQRFSAGAGRPDVVVPAVPEKTVMVRDSSRGFSTNYGYSADQILGMMGQTYSAAMAAPSDLKHRGTVQMLRRSVGVSPNTSGQMLFGLMRSKGRGFHDFALGLEIEDMSYGEQRGMFQLAGRMLGPEFARTGISGRATMSNIDSFTSQRGRSGFRAMQFAEGAVNYGRNIAQQGPQSPYDFALVSSLAGGGGVSPTELLNIYKGLETGDILKPGAMRDRFMGYLKSVRGAAGGDKGLETITLNKALQPILPGLGLSRTEETMQLIQGGADMDALREDLNIKRTGGGLEGIARTNVSKQQKRAAKIRNEVLSLGTEMIDSMLVFKEAAEEMAKSLKGAAPIMAQIHRSLATAVSENANMSMPRDP